MNWGNAREEIQKIFRHYKSKDPGKLFHMKFLMALNAKDRDAMPYYIYFGWAIIFHAVVWDDLERKLQVAKLYIFFFPCRSANFSTGAWVDIWRDYRSSICIKKYALMPCCLLPRTDGASLIKHPKRIKKLQWAVFESKAVSIRTHWIFDVFSNLSHRIDTFPPMCRTTTIVLYYRRELRMRSHHT